MNRQSKEHRLTQDYLKERFLYDEESGNLIWRVPPTSRKDFKGKPVSGKHTSGYLVVNLHGFQYLVHRLIYFMNFNYWPEFIDHIDGNRTNNKLTNLRSATRRENNQNTERHRKGALLGIYLIKSNNTWGSRITINGKRVHLGVFKTDVEAHKAYMAKLQEVEAKKEEVENANR